MKSQKLEQLLESLNELKSALQSPRVYIYQYFTKLKNEIDLECQLHLCNQKNLQTSGSVQAIDYQSQMIDQVEAFEIMCIKNCQFLELNKENVTRSIESIEAELKSLLALEDKRIKEINLLVEENFYTTQKQLFLNRSLIFIPRSLNLLVDIQSFGVLLVIEDEFVYKNTLLNRFSFAQTETTCHFNKHDLKALYLKEKIKMSLDNPIDRTYLAINQVEFCDLDNLTLIDSNLFSGMIALKELHLSCSKLVNLHTNIFSGLINLEKLNLSNNKLAKVDSRLFKNLTKLNELNLSYNKLTELDSKTFRGLTNLQVLNVSYNKLSLLDSELFHGLHCLKQVFFVFNKLTRLEPKCFHGLRNLTKLHVGANKLTWLDSQTFKGLDNLAEINLTNNQLIRLDPDLFKGLHKLKEINLSYNRLKSLELNTFQQLVQLEKILLDNNQLEQIDARLFEGLANLRSVHLAANRLGFVDFKAFTCARNLEEIFIQQNDWLVLDVKALNGVAVYASEW